MTVGEPSDYEIEVRREKAARLRRLGWSLRKIGRQLNVSHVTIFKDLQANLAELKALRVGNTEGWRDDQIERLRDVQASAWKKRGDVSALRLIKECVMAEAELQGTKAPVLTDQMYRFGDMTTEQIAERLRIQGVKVEDPRHLFETNGSGNAAANSNGNGHHHSNGHNGNGRAD